MASYNLAKKQKTKTKTKTKTKQNKNRTSFASKGVKTSGHVLNSLPEEIKLSLNVKIFRKQLRNNIFSTQ